MIDLHSHVLPGLDDGAPDDATALKMCRRAADGGVSVMVATPHCFNGLGPSDTSLVAPAAARLQSLLRDAGIPLEIRFAVEMPLVDQLVALYRSGEWLAYDPSRKYVLLELPPMATRGFDIACRAVSTLHVLKTTPILAHPERLEFLSDIAEVRRLVRLGARIQVTASALWSEGSASRRARDWLDDGLVACIATDAHSLDFRPPDLPRGRAWLAGHYGEHSADALVRDNPRLILEGAPLP